MLRTMKTSDREALEAMIRQMNASTARADAALDAALAYIDESGKRIAAMERKREQLLAPDNVIGC
jgi:septal ring factor EnvC (AmiA/AmiB activator)